MIDSCLILPTERPISLHEIKRALLTYDTVFVNSPDDRELIPPNSYLQVKFSSVGMNFPIGSILSFPHGPVRPLGKVKGFEDSFQEVMDGARELVTNGNLKIVNTPSYESRFTVGAMPLPADTPPPLETFLNYRIMANNPELVNLITKELHDINLDHHDVEKLSPHCLEEQSWSVAGAALPPLAKLTLPNLSEEYCDAISKIAHARIGSLSKSLGHCSMKELIPFSIDSGYGNVLQNLQYSIINSINAIDSDHDIIKRQKQLNAVERIVFREYFDPAILDQMKINDVMKLRSKAWGRHNEAKYNFINTVSQVAASTANEHDFEKEVNLLLREYNKHADAYRNEFEKLKLNVVIKSLLGSVALGPGSELLQRLLSIHDFSTLVVLGVFLSKEAANHLAQFIDYLDKVKDSRGLRGYSIYNHYSYVK